MNKSIEEIVEYIYKKLPFQKKKLIHYFSEKDKDFFLEFEVFLTTYKKFLKTKEITINECANSYIKMCKDMMKCQLYFSKNGRYPVDNVEEAKENVYNNEQEMTSYMIGLALSQFLWKTHNDMYNFLKRHIKDITVSNYLEIGPGHGLFLKFFLENNKSCKNITAVDISPISLKITQSIIEYFKFSDRVIFKNQDILDFEEKNKFDFIVMGEVLEHVEHPEVLLKKLRGLVCDNGKIFISTCVNCPAIDHVYHFKNVKEIQDMINKCGLEIIDELILPVENLPIDEIVDKKITINYCSLLQKG